MEGVQPPSGRKSLKDSFRGLSYPVVSFLVGGPTPRRPSQIIERCLPFMIRSSVDVLIRHRVLLFFDLKKKGIEDINK